MPHRSEPSRPEIRVRASGAVRPSSPRRPAAQPPGSSCRRASRSCRCGPLARPPTSRQAFEEQRFHLCGRMARGLHRGGQRDRGIDPVARGSSCRVSRRKPVPCAMPIWARLHAAISHPRSLRIRRARSPHWSTGRATRRPRQHRLHSRARSLQHARRTAPQPNRHRPRPRLARKDRHPTAQPRIIKPAASRRRP
jgi:hypothetical protein